jgi:hypothetical protein
MLGAAVLSSCPTKATFVGSPKWRAVSGDSAPACAGCLRRGSLRCAQRGGTPRLFGGWGALEPPGPPSAAPEYSGCRWRIVSSPLGRRILRCGGDFLGEGIPCGLLIRHRTPPRRPLPKHPPRAGRVASRPRRRPRGYSLEDAPYHAHSGFVHQAARAVAVKTGSRTRVRGRR